MTDYERIARAIDFLQANLTAQPSLDAIARHVHLSPFHFQRLFTRWAGTTPKRFLQVLTLELGKQLLREPAPLLTVAEQLGLSSSSRLHDHFVQIDAVTPGEFRSQGQGLCIRHGTTNTPFGTLFVAATARGICRAAFVDGPDAVPKEQQRLLQLWPQASLQADASVAAPVGQAVAGLALTTPPAPLRLHLHGTNFQLAVWRALLQIPAGNAESYGALAARIAKPQAVRAVGTAIGANPVAVLIPCHRVIQQSGALGGYRWGLTRKLALQTWERLHVDTPERDHAR